MPQKSNGSEWLVYILLLSNNTFYTGITNNLARRIKQHEQGKGSKYVRSHCPFSVVYIEVLENKSAALKREIEIKRLKHKDKKKLVGGINES